MEDEKRIIRGPQDGDDRILVPNERVITRNAGCWNCIFMRDASEFWFGDKTKGTLGRRDENLNRAVAIAVDSPLGENHPKVLNIRRMVEFCDSGVRAKAMIRCAGSGVNGKNEPVGELVANSFMCRKYVAATGASLAREGQRINDLPEEIREKIDGPDPVVRLEELANEEPLE